MSAVQPLEPGRGVQPYAFHRPPSSPLEAVPLEHTPRAGIRPRAYVIAVLLAVPCWAAIFAAIPAVVAAIKALT